MISRINLKGLHLFILLALPCCSFAQKISLLGVDTTMKHSRGNVHYSSILEHYFSENIHKSWNDKPISVTQFGTLVDYYIFDRIALGGAAHIIIPRGERILDNNRSLSANTLGLGLAGSLRIDVLNLNHHSFYIETQYGMAFTLKSFPPEGTPWNFMVKYGLGYTIHLSSGRFLNFGWRWMHISNGTGFVTTNPAYDGNGIYIGFKFAK